MSGNKDFNNTIYLAGSFSDFRDMIINSLPNVKFIDPRNNRQHAMYATNSDDLEAAINCPTVVGCFPKGKPIGVMTFVELGSAYASGSEIIIANENGSNGNAEDKLLKDISKKYFASIKEELIPYLKEYKVQKKEFEEPKENLGKIKNIYFCGTVTNLLKGVIIMASELAPKKNYILKSDNVLEDYKKLDDIQQMVVDFPEKMSVDRPSCFMMGIAVYKKIPILEKDSGEFPYSPLSGGLQRRLVRSYTGMLDYVVSVNDADISKEALHMYEFFERYDGRK